VEAGNTAISGPQAVVVKSPKVVFSGIQMAFGREDSDLRLAFERLEKGLSSLVGTGGVVAVRYYAMDVSLGQRLAGLGREMFHRGALAGSAVEVEGLPSLDASVGMEVVAEPGN
jgi:enamine deaminase RidA (YjgF/YER057c/UK114 family)